MKNILSRNSLLRQLVLIVWMAIVLTILKVNFSFEQDLKTDYVKSGSVADSSCKGEAENLKKQRIVRP